MPETLNTWFSCLERMYLKVMKCLLGEIVDFFYRVEFQQKGSPNIHALFCVKDAPQYEQNANEETRHFIDKYVTCKIDQADEMRELVNLQTHRHAKTCKKVGHNFW